MATAEANERGEWALELNEPLPPGQEKTPWCELDPQTRQEARDWSNGAAYVTEYDLDYDHWLPSINLLWRNMEGLQFRASYFKGVAPPQFGLTRGYFPLTLSTQEEDIEVGGVMAYRVDYEIADTSSYSETPRMFSSVLIVNGISLHVVNASSPRPQRMSGISTRFMLRTGVLR